MFISYHSTPHKTKFDKNSRTRGEILLVGLKEHVEEAWDSIDHIGIDEIVNGISLAHQNVAKRTPGLSYLGNIWNALSNTVDFDLIYKSWSQKLGYLNHEILPMSSNPATEKKIKT